MRKFFMLPSKNKCSASIPFWIVGSGIVGSALYYHYTKSAEKPEKKTVVIIGAGIAGLSVASSLGNHSSFQVIVVEPNNTFTYPPLLPQVAAGILAAHHITFPYTALLGNYSNIRFLNTFASNMNFNDREIKLANGETIQYDKLVVATGSRPNYFGHLEFEAVAPGLKTIEDATRIRDETQGDQKKRIGIVGAGPTGVALAALLASNRKTVELIEAATQILPFCSPTVAEKAMFELIRLGVVVKTKTAVSASKTLTDYDLAIWTAGICANSEIFSKEYREAGNRIQVQKDLTLRNFPNVWVIGDLSAGLPATAQVALQQAEYVTQTIKKKIPPEERPSFEFHIRGHLVPVGPGYAVGTIGEREVSGPLASAAEKFAVCQNLPGSFWNRCRVFSALMCHSIGKECSSSLTCN